MPCLVSYDSSSRGPSLKSGLSLFDDISCLDDTELELLGVPWETYLDVAASTGLDVLR